MLANLQLFPPHLYRAIDILKNHFIFGLDTLDSSFPPHLWYLFVMLATTPLNLLCPVRINPNLFAYEFCMEHSTITKHH